MTRTDLDRERRLQLYLAGGLTDDEARAFEDELLTSPEAAEDLMDELALRDLLAARRARRASFTRRSRRWLLPGLAAAAVVLAVWPRGGTVDPPVYRGRPSAADVAIEPVGEVSGMPSLFRWRRLADAASYRLEVFDASSHRMLVASTGDTLLALEPGQELPRRGYWRVVPIDAAGLPLEAAGDFAYSVIP